MMLTAGESPMWVAQLHGRHAVQAKWDTTIAADKAANDLAVDKRREDNRALAAKQKLDSADIQRKHDEEVSAARLAAAGGKRLRIGTALCPAAGPAEASRAASSDGAGWFPTTLTEIFGRSK